MAFMEKAKTVMAFVAIVALMGAADVAAQPPDCGILLQSMISCIPYVAGNDSKPSGECCAALTTVVNTNASCLCLVLNGNSGIPNLNVTKALALPKECNVPAPPPSSCAAPAPSPTLPPTQTPSPPSPPSPTPSPVSPAPSPPSPTLPHTPTPSPSSPTLPHTPEPSPPSPTIPHTPTPSPNAGSMFSPSIMAIISMASLALMKVLS